MSMIINVTKDKFTHVAVSLTFEEAQLLFWLKCRAIYCSKKIDFSARKYSIDLTEEEYHQFQKLVQPLGEIL